MRRVNASKYFGGPIEEIAGVPASLPLTSHSDAFALVLGAASRDPIARWYAYLMCRSIARILVRPHTLFGCPPSP